MFKFTTMFSSQKLTLSCCYMKCRLIYNKAQLETRTEKQKEKKGGKMKNEKIVCEYLHKAKVATNEEISELLQISKQTTSKILNKMTKNNKIQKIKRGMY